jgi:hypothetical protein
MVTAEAMVPIRDDARLYADLCADPVVGTRIYDRIAGEYERTVEAPPGRRTAQRAHHRRARKHQRHRRGI